MASSPERQSETRAIWQALLVTILWASSWVLIKFGLGNIPPLTFAGLRYTLAFALLLPLLLRGGRLAELRSLSRTDLGWLALLGLVYYSLTQGLQFVGLDLLPANTLSLMLSLSSLTIALAGYWLLAERLNGLQWAGVLVAIAGALIYFGSAEGLVGLGLLVGVLAVLANTAGAILTRGVNRSARISPLVVTVVSMGIGSLTLLAAGVFSEPWPQLTLQDWLIILWLAAVNTAFAFTLWNRAMQVLSAAQASVINNTMLIQIAILAWLFLGERPGGWQLLGLGVTALGTMMVNLRPRR
ncbi:MAG: DMT family transporter [Anaerolineales bacterium]|nr:DMT family transporter [Anaerolineales bacterium]